MNLAVLPLVFALLGSTEQDSSNQLLQEVRRLREAIETMVSTGARVQIVFGRLQLQEQRTATAARRYDDLRSSTGRLAIEMTGNASDLRRLEEALADTRTSPDKRQELEDHVKHFKRRLEEMEAERQRLQTEESMAATVLSAEQGRWADLNQQLEDLERVLAKRPN